MVTMPLAGRIYVLLVFAFGTTVIGHSIYTLTVNPIGYDWLLLAALTLVSGSATVRLPSIPATISISETFVFTSILLFGPAAGTLTVALDSLVISFWLVRRQPNVLRVIFNMSAPALSVWIAAHLFYLTAGVQPLVEQETPISALVPPLLLTTVVYFVVNSSLTAFAISFEKNLPPFYVWREHFLWLSLNYFGGASLAALFVVYTRDIDFTHLGIIIPLLLVIYLTFKTAMARVEDAQHHLAQMNSLYLSTIETLAMAIDAKDQVTHGHIRRVQIYATGLAKEMGMTSEADLRAVEASALLHDMGKLAIPEHILNKPGKLTDAEFDKMKRHASIGAEILSAIDFPYPVVPIVRHHHENWDGTGYPDGISGHDIPLGARVLSVVDCFDALTSDRPYRPELPVEEALRILQERSGSMYDPKVVSTFMRVHELIAPTEKDLATRRAVNDILAAELKHFHDDAGARLEPSSVPSLPMAKLDDQLRGTSARYEIYEIASSYLAASIPPSLLAYYDYDERQDELIATHTFGPNAATLAGFRVPLGLHLTGWVGSSRKTICNSDPALDIGQKANDMIPPLRSCLSTPLANGVELIGVLTAYTTSTQAYTENDRKLFEQVAARIVVAVVRARETADHAQGNARAGATVSQR